MYCPECKKAYGIYWKVEDLSKISAFLDSVKSNHKCDVFISINGIERTFTFVDFLSRLGYDISDSGVLLG